MVSDERVFKWLNATRLSGQYNMITEIATPLRKRFGLSQKEASDVWQRWADTFEEQHKNDWEEI